MTITKDEYARLKRIESAAEQVYAGLNQRIATHTKRSQNSSMPDGPAIVSVTFPEANLRGFAHEYVENHIANGIGIYLIRAARK